MGAGVRSLEATIYIYIYICTWAIPASGSLEPTWTWVIPVSGPLETKPFLCLALWNQNEPWAILVSGSLEPKWTWVILVSGPLETKPFLCLALWNQNEPWAILVSGSLAPKMNFVPFLRLAHWKQKTEPFLCLALWKWPSGFYIYLIFILLSDLLGCLCTWDAFHFSNSIRCFWASVWKRLCVQDSVCKSSSVQRLLCVNASVRKGFSV